MMKGSEATEEQETAGGKTHQPGDAQEITGEEQRNTQQRNMDKTIMTLYLRCISLDPSKNTLLFCVTTNRYLFQQELSLLCNNKPLSFSAKKSLLFCVTTNHYLFQHYAIVIVDDHACKNKV